MQLHDNPKIEEIRIYKLASIFLVKKSQANLITNYITYLEKWNECISSRLTCSQPIRQVMDSLLNPNPIIYNINIHDLVLYMRTDPLFLAFVNDFITLN